MYKNTQKDRYFAGQTKVGAVPGNCFLPRSFVRRVRVPKKPTHPQDGLSCSPALGPFLLTISRSATAPPSDSLRGEILSLVPRGSAPPFLLRTAAGRPPLPRRKRPAPTLRNCLFRDELSDSHLDRRAAPRNSQARPCFPRWCAPIGGPSGWARGNFFRCGRARMGVLSCAFRHIITKAALDTST